MFKNVGSNWVVSLVSMVAIYFITPFTIHKLGDDGYGTWNLINAITGYLALLALGVPMASVRYFAQHVASGDEKKLNETIGSCTALYLGLGAIALVVGLAALHQVPSWSAVVGIGFVVAAGVGAERSGARRAAVRNVHDAALPPCQAAAREC